MAIYHLLLALSAAGIAGTPYIPLTARVPSDTEHPPWLRTALGLSSLERIESDDAAASTSSSASTDSCDDEETSGAAEDATPVVRPTTCTSSIATPEKELLQSYNFTHLAEDTPLNAARKKLRLLRRSELREFQEQAPVTKESIAVAEAVGALTTSDRD